MLGRTFEEYRRYFLLEPQELIGKTVLDVAGGVSSFCAEANNLGIKVTALDPIYSLPREKIRERFDPDLESVHRTIGLVPTYSWGFYKKSGLHAGVTRARIGYFFLGFRKPSAALRRGRVASMPFADGEFDLTLVSYLLFAY